VPVQAAAQPKPAPAATTPAGAKPAAPDAAAAGKPGKPSKPARKGRRWRLLLVAIVLLTAAGTGGWWWMAHARPAPAAKTAHAKPASRPPAQYYALDPAFVVNLADADAVRYLQADVQLMTRDDATRAALELHAPAIRNRLLFLFGQQSAGDLALRSGKERLQSQALAEVRDVLKDEGAPDKVEALYFTSLVTQ